MHKCRDPVREMKNRSGNSPQKNKSGLLPNFRGDCGRNRRRTCHTTDPRVSPGRTAPGLMILKVICQKL